MAQENFDMDIQDMYNIITKQDQAWGIEGYEIKKKYVDPLKQKKEREYEEKRKKNAVEKVDRTKIPKRPNYIEEEKKVHGFVPAPNHYKEADPHVWVSAKDIEKGKKKPKNTKKNTYIDIIYSDKNKHPGVGKYNLRDNDKEVKKKTDIVKNRYSKIKYGEKQNFLSDYQAVAATNPGPGQHNPHPIMPKIKENKTKPKEWIEKHKKEGTKNKVNKDPNVFTYNVHPVEYDTFGKMLTKVDPKTGKIKDQKSNQKYTSGIDVRFKDPKKTKSLMNVNTPASNNYNLIQHWKGKKTGKKEEDEKKNWYQKITKGPEKSIYY